MPERFRCPLSRSRIGNTVASMTKGTSSVRHSCCTYCVAISPQIRPHLGYRQVERHDRNSSISPRRAPHCCTCLLPSGRGPSARPASLCVDVASDEGVMGNTSFTLQTISGSVMLLLSFRDMARRSSAAQSLCDTLIARCCTYSQAHKGCAGLL